MLLLDGVLRIQQECAHKQVPGWPLIGSLLDVSDVSLVNKKVRYLGQELTLASTLTLTLTP